MKYIVANLVLATLLLASHAVLADTFGGGVFASSPLTWHVREAGGPGKVALQVKACHPNTPLSIICSEKWVSLGKGNLKDDLRGFAVGNRITFVKARYADMPTSACNAGLRAGRPFVTCGSWLSVNQ